MRPGEPAGRVRCWQRWQASRDPSAAPRRPPSSIAKDFLGAAVTLAIIAAIVLQATNRLASQCGAGANPSTAPGACSGVPAIAHHAAGVVTWCAIACAALAATAFIWYMLWGYKSAGQTGGNRARPAPHEPGGPARAGISFPQEAGGACTAASTGPGSAYGSSRTITVSATGMISSAGRSASDACLRSASGPTAS